jgi:hypothetical protein
VLQHISAILAVSSGFDQPSMIESASSRILELGVELWKGWPTAHSGPSLTCFSPKWVMARRFRGGRRNLEILSVSQRRFAA